MLALLTRSMARDRWYVPLYSSNRRCLCLDKTICNLFLIIITQFYTILHTSGQFVISWASKGYCVFVTICGVLSLLACCIQIHRFGHFLHRGQDSSFLGKERILLLLIVMITFLFSSSMSGWFYLHYRSLCGRRWFCFPLFHVVGCSNGHNTRIRHMVCFFLSFFLFWFLIILLIKPGAATLPNVSKSEYKHNKY